MAGWTRVTSVKCLLYRARGSDMLGLHFYTVVWWGSHVEQSLGTVSVSLLSIHEAININWTHVT